MRLTPVAKPFQPTPLDDRQLPFPFISQVRQLVAIAEQMKARQPKEPYQPPPRPRQDPIDFVLISCSKSKLTVRAPARDLYTGQLFKRAVSWAERHDLPWFVVSALHELLTPDQEVSPYNYTIKDLRQRERKQWAHQLVGQLTRYAGPHSHAILLLPEPYRRFIEPELFSEKITYETPLAGMGIGRQMKWLAEN